MTQLIDEKYCEKCNEELHEQINAVRNEIRMSVKAIRNEIAVGLAATTAIIAILQYIRP